jgi:hypothetical protein
VRLTWERETAGDADAVTEDPPEEYVPPEFELPDLPPLPPMPPVVVRLPITKLFAATKLGGVYYTANFSIPGVSQPTWTSVNGGLVSTAMRTMAVDPADPGYRQYALTTDGVLYRRTAGDWSVILSIAASRVLAGGAAFGQVYFFCVDPVTGYLYARWDPGEGHGGGGAYPYCLRSIDYGATWSAVKLDNVDQTNASGEGMIDAYDGVVVTTRCRIYKVNLVYYSSDHGATFTPIEITDFVGDYGTIATINRSDTGEAYINVFDLSFWRLVRVTLATGAQTVMYATQVLGPWEAGGYWTDLSDPERMATLAHQDSTKLWRTIDGWTNVVDAAPDVLDIQGIHQFCEQADYGEWILGATINGTLCVRVSTDSETTSDRSGANNGTPPYTGAIPSTCGGIAQRGLQAVTEWG